MPGKERLISETYCAAPLVVKDGKPEFVGLEPRGNKTYRVFRDRSFPEAQHFTSSLVTDRLLVDETSDLILIRQVIEQSTGFWGSIEGQFLRRVLLRRLGQTTPVSSQ